MVGQLRHPALRWRRLPACLVGPASPRLATPSTRPVARPIVKPSQPCGSASLHFTAGHTQHLPSPDPVPLQGTEEDLPSLAPNPDPDGRADRRCKGGNVSGLDWCAVAVDARHHHHAVKALEPIRSSSPTRTNPCNQSAAQPSWVRILSTVIIQPASCSVPCQSLSSLFPVSHLCPGADVRQLKRVLNAKAHRLNCPLEVKVHW